MPGSPRFKIEGLKELTRALEQLGPEVASKVGDQALRAQAKVIVEEAQRLVPVDTGELRENMTTRITRKPRNDGVRLITIGWRTQVGRRAHLTEFGTVHSAAQPFLRPALDGKAGESLQRAVEVLGRGIRREAEKQAGTRKGRR